MPCKRVSLSIGLFWGTWRGFVYGWIFVRKEKVYPKHINLLAPEIFFLILTHPYIKVNNTGTKYLDL